MDIETATNPVGGEDMAAATSANETEVEQEAPETETKLGQDGNPVEEPSADDSEEIEFEGEKHKVPRLLKDAFLRQADYTRKTQELARERESVQALRQQVEQARDAEIDARANVIAIDRQLADYSTIDWAAWNDKDSPAAQKAFMAYMQLKDTRREAVGKAAELSQQRTAQAGAEKANRMRQAYAELQRDIPGYSPEIGAKLQDFGIKTFGFTAEELADFEDARMVKVLHAAFEGAQARIKATKAQQQLKAQEVKPAAPVRGSTPPQGLDDRISAEEWVRRRNEQVRKGR